MHDLAPPRIGLLSAYESEDAVARTFPLLRKNRQRYASAHVGHTVLELATPLNLGSTWWPDALDPHWLKVAALRKECHSGILDWILYADADFLFLDIGVSDPPRKHAHARHSHHSQRAAHTPAAHSPSHSQPLTLITSQRPLSTFLGPGSSWSTTPLSIVLPQDRTYSRLFSNFVLLLKCDAAGKRLLDLWWEERHSCSGVTWEDQPGLWSALATLVDSDRPNHTPRLRLMGRATSRPTSTSRPCRGACTEARAFARGNRTRGLGRAERALLEADVTLGRFRACYDPVLSLGHTLPPYLRLVPIEAQRFDSGLGFNPQPVRRAEGSRRNATLSYRGLSFPVEPRIAPSGERALQTPLELPALRRWLAAAFGLHLKLGACLLTAIDARLADDRPATGWGSSCGGRDRRPDG